MTNDEEKLLSVLESTQTISTSEKNLRSKIDSIVRSLENLSEKKARIDFEIKRQKKSLTRKREELKRVSKSNQAKVTLTLESKGINPDIISEGVLELNRLDSKLLQESNLVIEQE